MLDNGDTCNMDVFIR